jgi:DNA primase
VRDGGKNGSGAQDGAETGTRRSMKIPEATIREISDRVDIVDVVSEYVRLEKKGSRYWGLCPFHQENTPSFSVTPEKNIFYCFGCQKGGSVFTFVMEMEAVPFPEAVSRLGERVGIEVESGSSEGSGDDTFRALAELYDRLTNTFEYVLWETKAGQTAREYLAGRGISEETARRFRLGVAPADLHWLHRFLRSKHYSKDFLAESGLFSRKHPTISIFAGRLMFPITDRRGRTVAFGGRSMDGREPKYINSPETRLFHKRATLFGLSEAVKQIRSEGEVLLSEGYFDVLSFFEAEIPRAVAPLGTSLTEEHVKVLNRFTDRVTLVFDDDEAGVRAAYKAIQMLERSGLEARVLTPQGGKDPGEILEKEGRRALQNMLKYSINSFEYVVNKALENSNLRDPAEKSRIVRSLAPIIDDVNSEVKREEYIAHLADRIQIDTEAVQRDIAGGTKNRGTQKKGQPADFREQRVGTDLFLMLAAASNPQYYSLVRRELSFEDVIDPRARELYIAMEEAFREERLQEMDYVLSKLENEETTDLIMRKASSEEFAVNAEQVVKDSVRRIKIRSLEEQRRRLNDTIKKVEVEGADSESMREMLSEKMYLNEELKRIKGDA